MLLCGNRNPDRRRHMGLDEGGDIDSGKGNEPSCAKGAVTNKMIPSILQVQNENILQDLLASVERRSRVGTHYDSELHQHQRKVISSEKGQVDDAQAYARRRESLLPSDALRYRKRDTANHNFLSASRVHNPSRRVNEEPGLAHEI